MGWKALLRFSSVTSSSQRERRLFLAGTTVTWKGGEVAADVHEGEMWHTSRFFLDGTLSAAEQESCANLFLFGFRGGKKNHVVTSCFSRCGSEQREVDLSAPEVFLSAESPVPILAKTQKSPAWSRTNCSAVYVQEPANNRTLVLRPFYLLALPFAPCNSHHSSFLLTLHLSNFPPSCSFLKWLLPLRMPPTVIFRVCLYFCNHAWVDFSWFSPGSGHLAGIRDSRKWHHEAPAKEPQIRQAGQRTPHQHGLRTDRFVSPWSCELFVLSPIL